MVLKRISLCVCFNFRLLELAEFLFMSGGERKRCAVGFKLSCIGAV